VAQARDIFDLKLLLDAGAGRENLPKDIAAEALRHQVVDALEGRQP